MTLLDRLRRRPRWEDPDPQVRAEAVRHMDPPEQDVLERIAREDEDPLVRRAAVRRLRAPAVLGSVAASDTDPAVRDRAAETLLELACGEEEPVAAAALAALTEGRHLLQVVTGGRAASVRVAALERIDDARLLARAARTSEDAAVRTLAVEKITEPAALVDVATRSEHKDSALLAVERLDSDTDLDEVARRAKNKAAARRARARRDERGSTGASEPASVEPPLEEGAAPETVAAEPVAAADEPVPAAEPATEEAADEATPAPAEAVIDDVAAVPAAEEAQAAAPAAEGASEGAADRALAPAATAVDAERRKERIAHVEELCARLEALAKVETLGLREADAAFKQARAVQADVSGLPGRLVRRLKDARAAVFARAQELRDADEWRRWGNATVQEELCRAVEALVPREDLEAVARDLKSLDARWVEVKDAPRDEEEALRHRYQSARAQLRPRLDAFFARKTAEEAENLKHKEELVFRAEALADSTDWLKASEELKALQARWKEVGPVSRRHSQAVWNRFRGACDRFFTRRKEDLKHRKEQWSGNLARKVALCERAEALASSTDWEPAAAEIRKIQAEWKTIGPVRKDRSEEVWQRFRKAGDAFFDRYKHRDVLEREEKKAAREAVCAEAEALLATEGDAPSALHENLQALQARARQTPLPHPDEDALSRRLAEARRAMVERWPEAFRGTDLDPEASRQRKEKLCAKVEALTAQVRPPEEAPLTGADLARKLKEALATNTIAGRSPEPAGRDALEEMRQAQAAWSRLGPVPGPAGAALEERFRAACARVAEARRASTARVKA